MEHVNFVNSLDEKNFYDYPSETLWDWYCSLCMTPDSVDVGDEALDLKYQTDKSIYIDEITRILVDDLFIPFRDRNCLVMKCLEKLISCDFPPDHIPPSFRPYYFYFVDLGERCRRMRFH